jgi:hypothetical protein
VAFFLQKSLENTVLKIRIITNFNITSELIQPPRETATGDILCQKRKHFHFHGCPFCSSKKCKLVAKSNDE